MGGHDPLCRAQHMDVATEWDDLGGCDCPVIARVRADVWNQCGYRALEARDRTRYGSDAWSRLDRLAHDIFTSARTIRGGDDD